MIWIKYRFGVLFFMISVVSCTCFGQKVTINEDKFPDDWIGNWAGELEIFDKTGLKQSLEMRLNIHSKDSLNQYEWSIIYGPDEEKGLRAYELHPKDPENGVWAIDERNGIIIECFLLSNKLFSSYNVAERNFLVSYEKQGDQLIFEISFGPEVNVSSTGGKKMGEEEIPEVKAFKIGGLQRAVLKKVSN